MAISLGYEAVTIEEEKEIIETRRAEEKTETGIIETIETISARQKKTESGIRRTGEWSSNDGETVSQPPAEREMALPITTLNESLKSLPPAEEDAPLMLITKLLDRSRYPFKGGKASRRKG